MVRSTRVWLALATVYVVWGSTYLGIDVAIETIPPLLMSAVRFGLAGTALYLFAIRRGDREGDRPGARQWLAAGIVGGLLFLFGNGAVALAESRDVDTGVAALIIASVPLWFAVLEWVVLRRRLTAVGLAGIVVGLAGVGLLVGLSGDVDPLGAGVLLVGALAWSAGSLYGPRAGLPARPLVAAAMQMIGGSVLLAVAGVFAGELGSVQTPSAGSLVGLAYLVAVGSLVAFSAYTWLLRTTSSALVSTYAYVNPIVAVALGVTFRNEELTWRMVIAGGAIVTAVALIVRARTRSVRRVEPEPLELPPSDPALEDAA
jgi:drug/metabolite transporter (DMT)-like permease